MQSSINLAESARHFTVASVTIDGLEYSYREANPQGKRTIIVVHGVTGTSYSMLCMADDWRASGHRIIIPDLPGHGHSAARPLTHFADLAGWLHGFITATTPSAPLTLVGNSFGCAVIWVFLARFGLPADGRVVLGAPVPKLSWWVANLGSLYQVLPQPVANKLYFNTLANFIRQITLLGDCRDTAKRNFIDEALRVETPMIRHHYASRLIKLMQTERPFYAYHPHPDLLRRITVVYGANDIMAARQSGQGLARLLPGASLVQVPKCGHIVQAEAIPQLTAAVLGRRPPVIPQVSVVVPCLNEEHYIGLLLDDLACQTVRDFEVIVSDAASTDRTLEVVKSFSKRLDLRVVTSERGVARGRNEGAAGARGDWILFLDADVRLPSDYLARLLPAARQRNIQIGSSFYHPADGSWYDRVINDIGLWYFWASSLSKHPLVAGFCILVERTIHERIHGFDDTLVHSEDHDYAERAVAAGAKFGYLPQTALKVSMRRYRLEGHLKTLVKYGRMYWYRLSHGYKIDRSEPYTFGRHKPPPPPRP